MAQVAQGAGGQAELRQSRERSTARTAFAEEAVAAGAKVERVAMFPGPPTEKAVLEGGSVPRLFEPAPEELDKDEVRPRFRRLDQAAQRRGEEGEGILRIASEGF
jgi:hypothetical protein